MRSHLTRNSLGLVYFHLFKPFFSHQNIIFYLRPSYLRAPFHERNYGVKQGVGVYCELKFGSLRVSAYDCSYQINRCILSPSGTLLARNCSQSLLNHHVALMLRRLILCPPQLLPEDPPPTRLHPP
jgi:hypothetical protein